MTRAGSFFKQQGTRDDGPQHDDDNGTDMSDDLNLLREELLAAVAAADGSEALEAVRVSALGKKGRLTAEMKTLGQLEPEARKEKGQALNAIREAVTEALTARKAVLDAAELERRLEAERIDVTLPVRPGGGPGRLHPLSQTWDEIVAIFGEMGFTVAEGPDIEDDFHNFTALNIPAEHPARQEHDTFYLRGEDGGIDFNRVLRTPHQPGAGPHHGGKGGAGAGDRAGPDLPRRQRHDPHADVSPGGGAGH